MESVPEPEPRSWRLDSPSAAAVAAVLDVPDDADNVISIEVRRDLAGPVVTFSSSVGGAHFRAPQVDVQWGDRPVCTYEGVFSDDRWGRIILDTGWSQRFVESLLAYSDEPLALEFHNKPSGRTLLRFRYRDPRDVFTRASVSR